MANSIELNLPVFFSVQHDTSFAATLLTLQQVNDTNVILTLQLEGESALAVEAAGYFNNAVSGRVRPPATGFDRHKPLFFELALRQNELDAYSGYTAADYAAILRGDQPMLTPLLVESVWNTLMVWQETQLDASIGGGVIKYGYKTHWTHPENDIERIRRRGPVSEVMIQAFIENSWPVRLAEDGETLILDLTVTEKPFRCHLIADDADTVASVVVEYLAEVPPERLLLLSEWIATSQSTVAPGFFEYAEQSAHVSYHCLIQVPAETLDRTLIEGLVNLALMVMAQNATAVDEVIAGTLQLNDLS